MTSAICAHSVVEPSGRSKSIAGSLVVVYALLSMLPLFWIFLTAFKSPPDSIAYPPKVIFKPTMDGYCGLFSTISRQTPEYIASLPPPASICDRVARARNMVVAGPSNFIPRFVNSLVIAFGSTALSVLLGVMAAYAFSRFRVPGKDDLLFFLLSTRMLPFIPFIIGEGGQDWPAVAAATALFLVPILVFTVLLRKNLLRGITFGAVRK